jgi:hypothetical protein
LRESPNEDLPVLWTVKIEAASSDDEPHHHILPTMCRCLMLLDPQRSTRTCDPNGWKIAVGLEVDDVHIAVIIAAGCLLSAELESGLPFCPLIAITVTDGDFAAARK